MHLQTHRLITPIAACGLGLVGALALAPATAHAGLEACGNVYVAASASCEWIPEAQECKTYCEPVATYQSCAARLYLECDSECTASAETECTTSCEEVCVSDCDASADDDPPNCMGLCMSDCQQDCNERCDPSDGQCRASCAHTCSEGCQDECKDDGESCDVTCTQACTGSCSARANIDCQVDCQGSSFSECETEVVSECETDCSSEGGAVFCEGSYVAHGSTVDDCVNAIESEIDIDVEGWIEGECKDPEGATDVLCEIEGGLRCAVDDERMRGGGSLLGLFGLTLLALVGRRRREDALG